MPRPCRRPPRDTPLTVCEGTSTPPAQQASWRSGYAADCKALRNHKETNASPPKRYQDRPGTSGERDTPRLTDAEILRRHAAARHKAAGRLLFYALVSGEPSAWAEAGGALPYRLTDAELAALAFTSLRACDRQTRAQVIEAATRADSELPTDAGWRAAWAEAVADWRRATRRAAA